MKVNLRENYRRELTLERYDMAKQIIADMKEDPTKPEEYAKMALDHYFAKCSTVSYYLDEVVTASAQVQQNPRGYFQYSEATADMDIYIEALAKAQMIDKNGDYHRVYVEISCYMSTIWAIGDGEDYRPMMNFTRFVEEGWATIRGGC